MAITMTELAKRLNLSQSTVSLVLNDRDKGRVRPELAETIRRAAAETGFRPNRAAADLRRQRSNTIGVAMAYWNNPQRTELVYQLHNEIIRRNYRPLFSFFSTDSEQRTATELLLSSNLDAILTMEPKLLPDKLDLPAVSFFHEDPRFDAVMLDRETGLRLTLELLKKTGHIRIGWLGHDFDDERTRMIPELAAEYGLTLPEEAFIHDPAIYARMETPGALDLLRRLPPSKQPTVLLCHNDMIAFSAIRRLHECGIRVPEDMSVTGDDNTSLCGRMIPSLTSTGYETGGILAEKLIDAVLRRLETPEAPRRVEILPARLFPRESTAAARTHNLNPE